MCYVSHHHLTYLLTKYKYDLYTKVIKKKKKLFRRKTFPEDIIYTISDIKLYFIEELYVESLILQIEINTS